MSRMFWGGGSLKSCEMRGGPFLFPHSEFQNHAVTSHFRDQKDVTSDFCTCTKTVTGVFDSIPLSKTPRTQHLDWFLQKKRDFFLGKFSKKCSRAKYLEKKSKK